jgi:hypothetical protein
MATKTCFECGRVNGPAARRCIWCGLPVIDEETEKSFETTQIEIDYVSGIERLDESMPVRLAVGAAGVEVIEMMPGSRRVLIPAHELIEARAQLAGSGDDRQKATRRRRQFTIGKLSIPIPSGRQAGRETQEYVLTIKYGDESGTRIAVFRGEEIGGRSSIDTIARTISLLIRWRQSQKDRAGR